MPHDQAAQGLVLLRRRHLASFRCGNPDGGIPGIPDAGAAATVMAVLMLGNTAALAVAGWGLSRQTPVFYFFAVAVLVTNMVLTITNQMGVWDWLILALEAAMLGLLLSVATSYMHTKLSNHETHCP